ncbi:MAG: DUF3563 family protein [Collimonas sp.]|uniref:DUF3563 family protein n=1 Tax=Collimonas sp. TaxID=1963772 RepID=UPI003265F9DC
MLNKFSNINLFSDWPLGRWQKSASAPGNLMLDAEQAFLAAAADHSDLERRMRVLDCRHGSVLHTLRVLKVSSY